MNFISLAGRRYCIQLIERHKIFLLTNLKNTAYGMVYRFNRTPMFLFGLSITKPLLLKQSTRREKTVYIGAYLTGFEGTRQLFEEQRFYKQTSH
jgi:hypothetical protein